VRSLRTHGFHVAAIAEQAPGSTDEYVIELARTESRIVLTEDRDFGRLVFAAAHATSGVIYVRFPAQRRQELPGRILELIRTQAPRLPQTFAVVTPDRVRLTSLPR
jgi:predicted nuclease of predicted toxin-antitoxin system